MTNKTAYIFSVEPGWLFSGVVAAESETEWTLESAAYLDTPAEGTSFADAARDPSRMTSWPIHDVLIVAKKHSQFRTAISVEVAVRLHSAKAAAAVRSAK